MRSLVEVLKNLDRGNVIVINYDNSGERYRGSIIYYDGEIPSFVYGIDVGNFFDVLPNIKKQLENGYIYQMRHDFSTSMYRNSLLKRRVSRDFPYSIEGTPIEEFYSEGIDWLDGILELDYKISTVSVLESKIEKMNVL